MSACACLSLTGAASYVDNAKRILGGEFKPTHADILSTYAAEAAWHADVKTAKAAWHIASLSLDGPLPPADCIPAGASAVVFMVSLAGYDGPAEDNELRKQLLALRSFVNSPLANGRRVVVALTHYDVAAAKLAAAVDPKCSFPDYAGARARRRRRGREIERLIQS